MPVRSTLVVTLAFFLLAVALLARSVQADAQPSGSVFESLAAPSLGVVSASGTGRGEEASLRNKIEPALLKQLLEGTPGTSYRFLVVLKDQANLLDMPDGVSRSERASWVTSELQNVASRSQAGLLSMLAAEEAEGRVQSVRSFWVFNALAVVGDAGTLWALAARPEVLFLREDRFRRWVEPFSVKPAGSESNPLNGVQWNIARIHADEAWNALGLDGTGVTIAIMDTGVDWQHPALIEKYRGYKPGGAVIHEGNWICTTDEGYLYPVDGNGHGTHVTGTAVGGEDESGTAIGVAPGAQWIAAKMLNDQGYGYESWIHAAFEWVLAPAGDPGRAPDVVNGSWGSWDDADEAFRADVQALRAAGIVPVFAAGNNGPASSTLSSPGSYPEAVAVGAVDELDEVASFSSRGPSPWGETKPEVSAPGTQIRSSLPGGTYGLMYGTSMAAPHVAGLAAILLQALPNATVDGVEEIIRTTAMPLGDEVPNNDTGWGRIDAYQAAAVASGAGFIAGIVSHLPGSQPLAGAQVKAIDHLGDPRGFATTAESGKYRMALPPATYDLEVSAFGFASQSLSGVQVQTGVTTTVNASLAPLPSGQLAGRVSDAASGTPVRAAVAIPGTPVHTESDPATGLYSLSLPEGTFDVQVTRNGYRRSRTEGVQITAGLTTQVDIDLVDAPTLLLVDGGAWFYGSELRFFEQALEDRAYAFDEWAIRHLPEDVPSLSDLAPYDVVVWSSPFAAPGIIGAGDVISTYLRTGGNLFLTGQDIGYWDGGLDFVFEGYYTDLLKAVAVADDAGRDDVVGTTNDLLDGLVLPMNGPDSAGNQSTPDAFRLLDERDAAVIARYAGDWNAALRASGCQSYRAIYFAAGLEGLGDRSSRAEVLDRSLGWLGDSRQAAGADISPTSQEQVWLGQETITYTVELRNTGAAPDRFVFELSPSAWPTSVWDGSFARPLTASLELGACATQTLGIQVLVPSEVRWNASDAVTLTARSLADPASVAQARFQSKAPAPVLLVDDHRWYGQVDRYEAALDTLDIPYDAWRINPVPTPDANSPSLDTLRRYRSVVWFTSFDWYATLTPADEERLSLYLDGGGKLLLSSEDYLYTSEFTDFARDYLGVAGYTEALSSTQVFGAEQSPIAAGLGPDALLHPFPNMSDALRPLSSARVAWWGQHGQPAALSKAQAAWKTAFFAFALEAMSPEEMPTALGRALRWLSPLGDSSLTMDRAVATPGEVLTCTLLVRNTASEALSHVILSNTVPISASYVMGSLSGPAKYDPGTNRFTWSGSLEAGVAITVAYALQLSDALSPGASVDNVAHLEEESGLAVDLQGKVRIGTPDLSSTEMRVSLADALPGQVLTYTLALHNDGLVPAPARLVDSTPPYATYVGGSAWASSGILTPTASLLEWSGVVPVGQSVTILYAVTVDSGAAGRYVLNRAQIEDGWEASYRREAATWVESLRFFPIVEGN